MILIFVTTIINQTFFFFFQRAGLKKTAVIIKIWTYGKTPSVLFFKIIFLKKKLATFFFFSNSLICNFFIGRTYECVFNLFLGSLNNFFFRLLCFKRVLLILSLYFHGEEKKIVRCISSLLCYNKKKKPLNLDYQILSCSRWRPRSIKNNY